MGGCDFPVDPDQPAGVAPLFWLPELLPDALHLQPAVLGGDNPAAMPIDLAHLSGLHERSAVDGTWHGLWHHAGQAHQFWLAAPPMTVRAGYVVIVPLDLLTELRVDAVLRFWCALTGRQPVADTHDLPPQTRSRHILMLRALDGRDDGASYRKIAETLLGFRGSKGDWEADPRKNRARRLVADGRHYMRGGYRDLLRYPVRLPRRR